MTISIWRYSHLVLAIFTSIFLFVVSVTGIILSFEPILDKSQPFGIDNSSTLNLAKVIKVVKKEHEDVLSLRKNKNGFVILETEEGKFYINPFNAEKIGDIQEKSDLFKYVTSLHRSLFLNSLGRAFIGITSFLFFFILLSGTVLIIKRQNSLKQFFGSIVKDTPSQYYHIIFGRITLVPLIVLALTGSYLSMLRFKIIPTTLITHKVDLSSLEEPDEASTFENFEIFKTNKLDDLRELNFPLFEDIEEVYKLKLNDRELYVNQFDGSVISEKFYPFTGVMKLLSFNLHTGKGSIIWSIILGLSMISIPYFIYSGFVITLTRRKGRIKNLFKKDEAKFIILVGSENGSTRIFAKMLHNGLMKIGEKSFMADLNNYSTYKNMEHLIVLTSTYGQGDPPINATKFIEKFNSLKISKDFNYSVVGFGSLSYPDYCKYAYEVDDCINKSSITTKVVDIHTVNNRSFESYSTWVTQWGEKTGYEVQLPKDKVVIKRKNTIPFKVVEKTNAKDNPDDTFLIEISYNKKHKIKSGDLLAIYPKDDNQERLYSLAELNKNILLSVKRHQFGVCSNYLNDLQLGESLEAYIIKNKDFHFPKNRKVIMIATGTGIAPFLGMIINNNKNNEAHLYWGAKNKESFKIYESIINEGIENKRLTSYVPAYSRETNEKVYVQNLIERDHEVIVEVLKNKGVIMICGSIAMQKEVMEILNKYCLVKNEKPISHYTNKGQIKIDCY